MVPLRSSCMMGCGEEAYQRLPRRTSCPGGESQSDIWNRHDSLDQPTSVAVQPQRSLVVPD